MTYTIQVNGTKRTVDVDGDMPLLWVLRDVLDLKGSTVRSCSAPISSVGNAAVTTIEEIGDTQVGKRVQAAWLDVDVVQCGYCQAGQIMSATALLTKTARPTDKDIDKAMAGNVCRCCTYTRIRAAIKKAAGLHAADAG